MQNLTRKEKEKQARRSGILDKSMEIFALKGFHGTTMAEISRYSEFPLGTIYSFFSGKEQIFYEMMMEKCKELGRKHVSVFDRKEWDPLKRLMESITISADFYCNNKSFIILYISQRSEVSSVLDPELFAKLNHMHDRLVERYRELFQEGTEKGIFNCTVSRDAAYLFTGIVHSSTWFWLTEPDVDEPLEKKLKLACNIFLNGICT